ncbi:putative zinc-binding protein [Thermophagus sp. OGC60D27]|uniref:putative zinc-binding protein n=1 Tax=Thermophagus sp. OGC60D27 TaxID=3458415 RepID=UPI00403800D2
MKDLRAKDILVIDGCPNACGKRMLEQHNLKKFKHLEVTEKGFKKGSSQSLGDLKHQ